MMTTSWFSLWAMTNSPIYFSLLAEPLAQAGQIVTGPPSASDALIGGCILDVGERIERDGPCPGATEREHFAVRLFANLGESLDRDFGKFTARDRDMMEGDPCGFSCVSHRRDSWLAGPFRSEEHTSELQSLTRITTGGFSLQ